MPRYYFHYQDFAMADDPLLEDQEGRVFNDTELARSHARVLAVELAQSGEPAGSYIIVANESRRLFEVPIPRWVH